MTAFRVMLEPPPGWDVPPIVQLRSALFRFEGAQCGEFGSLARVAGPLRRWKRLAPKGFQNVSVSVCAFGNSVGAL